MNASQNTHDRRWFLFNVPAAAAAGIAVLSDVSDAQTSSHPAQKFTATQLQGDIAALQSAPGNNKLVDLPTFTVALTVEKSKAQQEFEWHENRDHVFQIIDGSTVVEVGGTPKNAHSSGPGEWNAPESENAEKVSLNQGDMLIIPRGTPHRRITRDSVILMLISPQGRV